MNANLSLPLLPSGTSPLTVVPITGHKKGLEEPWGSKGEQDTQFELFFKVNVILTCCPLCLAIIKSSGRLYSIVSY